MSEAIDFLTPVGRLVSGSLFKAETTDGMNNPLLIKNGPNAGQPTQRYNFGLAIPKTDPGVAELYGKFLAAGKQGFPSLFDAAGNCIMPTFSLKVKDGDSDVPNSAGNKPCDKEGYPGNFIFWFSGSFAPKVYDAANMPIVDATAAKRGDYIRVRGSVKDNASKEKPGVYCNYNLIQVCGYGAEISSGPDAATAFAAPVELPQGASATPIAPAAAPALPGATPIAPAAAPALPGALPVAAPVSAALPAPGFTAPVAAPAVAPAAALPPGLQPGATTISPSNAPGPAADFLAPPAAAVAEPSYNVQGQVMTKSALVAAGYTDAHFATMTAV